MTTLLITAVAVFAVLVALSALLVYGVGVSPYSGLTKRSSLPDHLTREFMEQQQSTPWERLKRYAAVALPLLFIAVWAIYIFATDVLQDYEMRFRMAPGKAHLRNEITIALTVAEWLFLIWFLQRKFCTDISLGKRVRYALGQAVILLGFMFLLWGTIDEITGTALFRSAQQPDVVQGTVTRAGRRAAGKTRTQDYATLRLADGTVLTVRSYHSMHSLLTGYAIKVNGTCTLNHLSEGQPITVHIRRSDLGYAVDHLTSPGGCQQN